MAIPEVQDRAYKPEEIAQIMNVTVYTVHDWLRSGALSGIKFKSHWRVMRSDLDHFIESRRNIVNLPLIEV